MHRSLLVIAALAASSATAQEDIDTTLSVPGMQVDMQVRGAQTARTSAKAQVAVAAPSSGGVGDIAVECAPGNGIRPSVLKLVGFEGAMVQVWNDDGSLEGQYTLPFNFQGRGDTFYRFVVASPDGTVLLDRKLETKMYVGCQARLGALRGSVGVRRGPGPAAPAGPGGMSPGDFAALLEAVNAASFSDEKTGVVATAAQSASFTVSQVGQLIDAMSFSADKLKTLELTKNRLVDRQNGFKLLEHFTFSSDKQKAQALLR